MFRYQAASLMNESGAALFVSEKDHQNETLTAPNALTTFPTRSGEFQNTNEMRKERTLLSNVSLQVPPTSSAHEGKSLGLIDNEADVSMSKSRKDAINHTQIIIVTTKRSGSSFVGELFNVNPNVFYVFEPLSLLTRDMMKRRFPKNEFPRVASNIWNHILRCDYSTGYPPSSSWLKRGNGGFDSCRSVEAIRTSKLLCQSHHVPIHQIGPVVSGLCRSRPYTLLKTIRVQDISQLQRFVEDATLNVKILHLVRDPRAVMKSRWNLNEINSDLVRRKGRGADEVYDLCEHMARNLKYNQKTPVWLEGKYKLVRFEDIAQNPVEETRLLYKYLGMEIHPKVIAWIENNTHSQPIQRGNLNPFSLTRDTSKVINAWKANMSNSSIARIERTCRGVMNQLKYQTITKLL